MAGGGAGVERGLWIVRQHRALIASPAPELRPPAEMSSRPFRFRERRPGVPPDPNNQVWIFRFCLFSKVCREENFPARESDDISAGAETAGLNQGCPPVPASERFFSVSFLINGLQGGKFPYRRIRRRFGGVGEPPLREDVAAAERHLPQPVQRASRRPFRIFACATPLRCRAGDRQSKNARLSTGYGVPLSRATRRLRSAVRAASAASRRLPRSGTAG